MAICIVSHWNITIYINLIKAINYKDSKYIYKMISYEYRLLTK